MWLAGFGIFIKHIFSHESQIANTGLASVLMTTIHLFYFYSAAKENKLTISGELFSEFEDVYLLINESAHTKKGDKSVGVARQYSGQLGKVDNCQVAVYAVLSASKYYILIDARLFLPEQ